MAYQKKPSRKTVKLLNLEASEIDYKNTDLLRNFVDSTGKIVSFKQTGLKAKLARSIKRAIKRSRALGLMPYMGTLPNPKRDREKDAPRSRSHHSHN